jgi:signal transduction histidine kinase
VDYSDEIIADAAHRVMERFGALGRRPMLCDTVIASTLALVSFIGLAEQHRLGHADTIVFCLLLVAPLPLRALDRRLSFLLIAVVALVQWLTSTPQIADGSVLFALFWVVLDGRALEVLVAAAMVEAGAIMAALRWTPAQPGKPWVAITGLAVAAGAIGLAIRERRQLVASLQERAARLELERDQEGRLGALAERSRIAREMHDIVSHNLTVMIGLADGAGYALEESPDDARAAIQRLSATGRQALGEMRRLLGVLREEPAAGSYEPQPGLDRLDDLLERVEAAGIPVSLEVSGDPQVLSAGMQLTLFRVAQEALTNTLKHAGRPATAHLSLSSDGAWVVLEVTDTGGARALGSKLPSAGRGLAGMRERAAAFAGELEAGPLPGGGWRVRLTLAADSAAIAS